MTFSPNDCEEIILVLAPSSHDAKVACSVLEEASLHASPCSSIDELTRRLEKGCGALIISEEALTPEAVALLESTLDQQEPWSDLPILILTGSSATRAADLFAGIGNISLLERPFSRITLISSVKTALRARRKQFEVRTLLKALRTSKEDADKANAAKGQFLANMSHEIRTPLGAIVGFVDLLSHKNKTSEEDADRYREIIIRNSHHLMRLIDEILDLSKVEAGKLSIEKLKLNLPDLLGDVASLMQFKAQEKGIGFSMILTSEIPREILSDTVRLRQILWNVIGNAIKFTSQGSVDVAVGYENPFLTVLVSDTGVGLTSQQSVKLFKPFAQADASTTRRFGGTGLGLILSKKLAEALGGDLELVHSQQGLGSTFKTIIKAEPSEGAHFVGKEFLTVQSSKKIPANEIPQLQGLKVLLVEDSPDNQILIKTYLKKSGAEISSANDGVEGVEKALSEVFDVVLMDLQMPRMDGHSATKKLRQSRYDKPIVALTAHAMKDERLRCFESGFTDFLTKPIQPEKLMEVLARYTST